MKRWLLTAAAGLTLLAAGAALALAPGDTVFVRAKNTRIFRKPDAAAEPLGRPVQPGTELVWHGRVKNADLPWQQVSFHGKKGYVLGSNLSATRPSTALAVSHGAGEFKAAEIASSGDAVKALGPGAKAYGQELKNDTVVPQLETLERIGDDLKSHPARLEALQEKNHLNTAGVAATKRGGK